MSFELGAYASRVSCRAASNSATELLTEAAFDAIALQRCRRSWRQTKESPAQWRGSRVAGGGEPPSCWVSCRGSNRRQFKYYTRCMRNHLIHVKQISRAACR